MKLLLIGLTGGKGVGKNTVGNIIAEWSEDEGRVAELKGFADLVKLSFTRQFVPDAELEEALEFWDWFKWNGRMKAEAVVPGTLLHRFGNLEVSGRQAAQRYGDEGHRQIFGNDFWVDRILPRVDDDPLDFTAWNSDSNVRVLTDVRYNNEAERILGLGGIIFEVVNQNNYFDKHKSEAGINPKYIGWTIDNSYGKEDLREETYYAMDNLYL